MFRCYSSNLNSKVETYGTCSDTNYLRWRFHSSDGTNVTKPPADAEYIEDASLFIWRPHGILDEAEVNKVLVDLIRRETTAEKPFNRFSDLSLVESFPLTFKYVFHVALHRRLSYVGRERIKSAFYVTNPEAVRVIKIHALLTDVSPLEVEMFETREAAAKWLGVPVGSLLPKASGSTTP